MLKLLAVLIFVPSIGFSDPQDVRFVLTNTPHGSVLVDSKTGKVWEMFVITGESGHSFVLSKFWRYDKGQNVCSYSPTGEEFFTCVPDKK